MMPWHCYRLLLLPAAVMAVVPAWPEVGDSAGFGACITVVWTDSHMSPVVSGRATFTSQVG